MSGTALKSARPEARGLLPDFIVIGAMRSATTALHGYLDAHPDVGMSLEKETDFFVEGLNYRRGFAWYGQLFPKGARLRGESSTNYTKHDVFKGVPERIHAAIPDVRLIYVVRDPVDRAASHYAFCANNGQDVADPAVVAHVLETSRYARQLESYLAVFPIERILVLDYDEIRTAPQRALGRVQGFLGLATPWPALLDSRSNESERLARMPLWFLRFRRNPVVSDLRRALQPGVRRRLRQVMELGPARQNATADEAVLARFRAELAEDAARFRALTGLALESWSI